MQFLHRDKHSFRQFMFMNEMHNFYGVDFFFSMFWVPFKKKKKIKLLASIDTAHFP